MNIFIAIMLVFAAAGLLDEILGGKLGLMPNFEKGLATMGGLAMSTVGFYAIGVTYVQTHAETIAEAAKHMPFDPALIPSCLLAPDMGALGMAQKLAATPALARWVTPVRSTVNDRVPVEPAVRISRRENGDG